MRQSLFFFTPVYVILDVGGFYSNCTREEKILYG